MKPNFLKEWTPQQRKTVEKRICKFIASRYWETHHSPNADPFIKSGATTYAQMDKILGLAYTSSSDFAGLWACNTSLYLDNEHKFHLQGFALDQNSFTHAIFWNDDENEIIFPI